MNLLRECGFVKRDMEKTFNVILAGALWGLWLIMIDLVFHNVVSQDLKMILRKIWRIMSTWKPMCPGVSGSWHPPMVQLSGGNFGSVCLRSEVERSGSVPNSMNGAALFRVW
jgi:hypothetical protein